MKIGFIGAGNMGGALAKAISKISEIKVYIYDKNCEKSEDLARLIGGFSATFEETVNSADFVFLGVKPNVIPDVAQAVGKIASKNTVIVSMAAGIKISKIEEALASALPVIRIMPNTPVAVGEGLTAYATNGLVSSEQISNFERIMIPTGTTEALCESEIDSFCAIAGCGPAYAYMFIEALANGAEKCGVPRERAIKYASKMIRGACLMALETETDPKTLCQNVCSPGGATVEGVKVLDAKGFSDSVSTAIEAAFKRTKELGDQ